ncbi:D-alanine--D-alanine ligase [Fretibacter rubidus]|uniref:D-alanine--D-alanine ligase n=1 Tax=Fretibacter rubidus TaxID=570162 RepID=UPI00352BC61E
MSQKIAVLLGGLSAERAVSLVSGQAIITALSEDGYDVTPIDAATNLWEQLIFAKPDVIINALHGEWGEDGRVQAVLDLYGKPYSHSGVMASALAMDKHRSKAVMRDAGITVAAHRLVPIAEAARTHVLPVPYVIKPNAQGSSVGIYLVHDASVPPPQEMLDNDDMGANIMGEWVMVEQYAPGRELTVSVMDGRALCVTEIVPKTDWYDYEAKYSAGGSVHEIPANIPAAATELAMEWAVLAHNALGCRGVSRSDFRFDDRNLSKNPKKSDIVNKMVMLELNTQPGMTPTSLVPEQAAHVGLSFKALCRWMVEDASWPR